MRVVKEILYPENEEQGKETTLSKMMEVSTQVASTIVPEAKISASELQGEIEAIADDVKSRIDAICDGLLEAGRAVA